METTINKKQMINAKSANDLEAGVIAALPKIVEFVKKNDYIIKNDDNFLQITNGQLLTKITNGQLRTKIADLSLKKRKALRNYLWTVDKYPTLKNVNKFLHFLMSKVLKTDFPYKVLKSEKQLKIEEKRKKYIEALNIAKKAHADYKEEKGNLYKLRLSNNQKIE